MFSKRDYTDSVYGARFDHFFNEGMMSNHDDDFYANDPSIDELEELIYDEEDDDLSYDDDAFPDDYEAGEDADWDD